MREILFRGKTTDRGEWVQGCYTETLRYNNLHWIWNGKNHFAVNPETIGQYTGLTDKNGKKIFEGDIVVINIKGYNTICKVSWAGIVAQFQLWQTNTIPNTPTALNLGNYDCEVIGNIHDNPELLESEATK